MKKVLFPDVKLIQDGIHKCDYLKKLLSNIVRIKIQFSSILKYISETQIWFGEIS